MYTQGKHLTATAVGILMCLLMLVNLMPTSAFAVDAGDSSEQPSTTWEYSKSKTATNLDGDLTSNVTLSLPSADEQLTTEVCFVVDKSQFADTKDAAFQLLDSLNAAVKGSGAKVKVDVVGFNRAAFYNGSFDLATQYDEIKAAFDQTQSGGTNMHAGLLKAKEVLARDTSIPNSRKYMILVSDGDSYLYCPNGDYSTPCSRSYIPVESAGKGGQAYGGYYDEGWYCPSAGYTDSATGVTNVKRPTTSSQSDWDAYLADVASRNTESNGDLYDFVWKYYDDLWMFQSSDQVAADGFVTQPAVPRSASNIDMAFYYAANTYHELASQYHCYAMATPSWNTAEGGHKAFMDYLNNGAASGFENIQNEILYLLGAGSTVDDYMGYVDGDYNFDLVSPEKMTVTVDNTEGGTQTYEAQAIGENQYGFGPQLDDGTYSYEVTYIPGTLKDDEHLVWKMNVPVTNFAHVSLHYTVKLTNPSNEAGTFGEYDADGSQGEDGLFTNNSAVLNPVASDGTAGQSEAFAKPTVSYTLYQVVYDDGFGGKAFASKKFVVAYGTATPAFGETPTKDGYVFVGWDREVADTVTGDVTYVAQWKPVEQPADNTDTTVVDNTTNTTGNTTSADGQTMAANNLPQTHDTVNLAFVLSIIAVAALVLVGALMYRRKQGGRR